MNNIEIRQETDADFSDVYEVNAAAFGQDNEAKLVVLLRQSSSFTPALSLVAVINHKVAGYILFSKIKIHDKNGEEHESLALAPLAVLPALQNRGIGSALVRFGLNRAKELGYQSVIVLGHKHYYSKFGFAPADKWNIKATFEVSPGNFMAIELVKDGLKNISGTVEYPKAFMAV